MNILFVCTGNTCRSPLAAAQAMARLKAVAADAGFAVASAGIYADVGDAVSQGSANIALAYGLDLSAHQSQQLTAAHLAAADRVYTMTRAQAERLAEAFPAEAAQISPLAEQDIHDPFGWDQVAYERTYQDIVAAIEVRLLEWMKEVQS